MGLTAEKYYSFPIASITKAAGDDDDLIVRGRATDGTLDHDMQVVDPAFSGPALKTWLSTGGNVRMSHDPQRPIGKGISAETDSAGATWVTSAIADPLAQKFLRRQILRFYSVGIANARIRADPAGRATGGIIYAGDIIELTLCDRGSNPACGVTLVKARGDGTAEYVGKTFGGKVRRPKVGKAFRRELEAWDLNSSDPWVREASRGLHL